MCRLANDMTQREGGRQIKKQERIFGVGFIGNAEVQVPGETGASERLSAGMSGLDELAQGWLGC
jgi:hypothetical protein